MKPEIIISIIAAAALLLPLSIFMIIRSWVLAKTRFICSYCGYRFRVKWYKRPFVRRRGKDQANLTCPVCRTHGLFRWEEEPT